MNSRQMVTHHRSKRARTGRRFGEKYDLFDQLSDDVASFLLSKLSSSVSRPSDFFNVLLTCKRMKRLALDPLVLSNSGPKMFAVKARSWSDSSHLFLKRCVDAGSPEASYTLGMIRFYCLQNWSSGASLMAKAAVKSHALALYSFALIQFNGSGGGCKSKKNLAAGAALCQRAAFLGHLNALRELGHCIQDGYGVPQNVKEGRRLLTLVNTREFALLFNSFLSRRQRQTCSRASSAAESCACVNADVFSLVSDFVRNVPTEEVHPVNQFLRGWFEGRGLGDGLRLCSYGGCGRPETRRHEFRRCSVCCTVNYCSRGCQAMDWKVKHRKECLPVNEEEHLELDFVEMEEEEELDEEAATVGA